MRPVGEISSISDYGSPFNQIEEDDNAMWKTLKKIGCVLSCIFCLPCFTCYMIEKNAQANEEMNRKYGVIPNSERSLYYNPNRVVPYQANADGSIGGYGQFEYR